MKKEQIFKEYYSQTKEEIIEEFKSHYQYYQENDELEGQSKEQKEKYVKLCKKFLEELKKINLPRLTDDWWCYSYLLKNDSIDLDLSFCEELEIEKDEVVGATFASEYTLLSVKCEYMTVAEYAKLYDVTEITVRQWIRRGKIRTAKKQGRDWMIPDITDKPRRGYESVSYYWKELSPKIIEKFPFLEGYNNLFIFQDKEDKGLYNVILQSNEQSEKIKISNNRREKLELELISSGQVEADEFKIYHT